MGYQVKFMFHERIASGEYNKEEVKEMTKKVGSPFEDCPLEKLVKTIFLQLARRDVWVVDVEIVEFVKKKVTFRECNKGIVVGNKKFLFEKMDGELVCEEEPETSLITQPAQPNVNLLSPQRPTNRVLYNLTFEPHPHIAPPGKLYTIGKSYPVYQKVGKNEDEIITIDDAGKKDRINEKYFIPAQINLYADKEVGFTKPTQSEPKLMFDDNYVSDAELAKLGLQ